MAILNRLAILPTEQECSILSQVQGVFEIWQPKMIPGAVPQEIFLLNRISHIAICIRSDYKDVRFKFECLYLTVCQKTEDKICIDSKIGVANLEGVKVILRAEWERSSFPGEVPPHYEQIVQVRGSLGNIPKDAPACISVVGILLIGENGINQGLIYLDDDFPLLISYVKDAENINQFILQSSLVELTEVARIRIDAGSNFQTNS